MLTKNQGDGGVMSPPNQLLVNPDARRQEQCIWLGKNKMPWEARGVPGVPRAVQMGNQPP